MICAKTVGGGTNSWSSWQSLYESQTINLGNWPVEFTATPFAMASNVSATAGWVSYVKNVSKTSAGSTVVIRPNTTQYTFDICVIGFGKWK